MVVAHLFVKVPRSGDTEANFLVFESSYHLLLPIKPLKRRGNLVKYLVQGHKRNCLLGSPHYPFNVERQARKLWIPTF